MLMRKVKFWACADLYDIGAKNIQLHMENIKCIGTATTSSSSLSIYDACTYIGVGVWPLPI